MVYTPQQVLPEAARGASVLFPPWSQTQSHKSSLLKDTYVTLSQPYTTIQRIYFLSSAQWTLVRPRPSQQQRNHSQTYRFMICRRLNRLFLPRLTSRHGIIHYMHLNNLSIFISLYFQVGDLSSVVLLLLKHEYALVSYRYVCRKSTRRLMNKWEEGFKTTFLPFL